MQQKPRLTRTFQFRLSEQEHADLETASTETGLSPSLIARLALKRALKEGVSKPFPDSPPGGREDG